jgi:hypothetical protein
MLGRSPVCETRTFNIAGKRTAADIGQAVENVMVEGGWVTLSGDVDLQYQREASGAGSVGQRHQVDHVAHARRAPGRVAATDGVRYLMGVTGVSDQIRSKPSVTATGPPPCQSGPNRRAGDRI